MSLAASGMLLGGVVGLTTWRLGEHLLDRRRTPFEARVLPYVRDLPDQRRAAASGRLPTHPSTSAVVALVQPWLDRLGGLADRVLGGSAGIARRLDRAGQDLSVHDFRVQQVLWGLTAFACCAVPAAVLALHRPGRAVPLLLCCALGFVLGVLLRENRLTADVSRRERRLLEELPTLIELLALAVASGESPVAALDRVVSRSNGELSAELRKVLAEVRTGTPIARAFDALSARTGLSTVARFAESLAVAVERGTPLADVLHAQAGDVREARRRDLIESGARREVAMMVPVVFLVLPVVVVFAFWPGLIGLRMVVP